MISRKISYHDSYWLDYLPTIGIIIFAVMYVYASTLYPGGSQANLEFVGFDWINNYWCNLLSKNGMNGIPNPARPIAISAMIILCFSLSIFFFQFSHIIIKSKIWRIMIKVFGILSMLFAALIFTKYHDLMTIISSFFGLFVLIGIIKGIYQSHLSFYKLTGLLGILLLGVNNLIYYSKIHIELLPIIQKITFVIVLFWVIGLNLEMAKKKSNR